LIYEDKRLDFAKNLYNIYDASDINSSFYTDIFENNPLVNPTAAKKFIEDLVLSNTA
jgi:hypothetical protein